MTSPRRVLLLSAVLLGIALLFAPTGLAATVADQPAKKDRAAKKPAKTAPVKPARKQKKDPPLPPPKTPAEELAAVNTKAMRLALDDLIATFGSRYPKGPQYIERLAKFDDRKQAIQAALAKNDAGAAEQIAAFVKEFRGFQQEALLANPLLDFDRLLLVKRDLKSPKLGLPQNWQGNCALPKSGYDNEIAVLSPVRPEGKLTTLYKPQEKVFVGDLKLHFDADRLAFSMPASPPQGRWQIWEMKTDGTGLRQVTKGDEPDVDNYTPCYLPNGRIIFDSTRCFQGVPCVGGSNTVANLCIMDADGSHVRQLCFDQDHDWYPTLLNDGRVLYTRWEYTDSPHYFTRLLFHMNPDGTNQMEYYGSNSPWPNSTFYAKPIPGHPTMVVGVISGHHGVPRMGELILFDPALGRHQADGVVQRIPGHGVKVEPVIGDQIVANSWPKFLHPWPLSEKYFLVAMQPDARSLWGIYLVDVFDNLTLIKELPGYVLFEPVPLRKTDRPPTIPDRVEPQSREAVVYVSDIYAGKGLDGVPHGTVKRLRLFEQHYAYPGMGGHIDIGIDGPWDVHRILGTVPVEADGSASFKVPANTPIAVQPLDEKGRSLQIMRSWFTAMPGERVSCVGCHESQNAAPPRKPTLAMQRRPSDIQPWYGPARGFSFAREVQPVLDKYCVGCHDGSKTADGSVKPDFRFGGHSEGTALGQTRLGKKPAMGNFTPSYVALHPYVRRPGPESDYFLQQPLEYHASVSELVQILEKGHYGVKLDAEAWDRLTTWIDLNVPDHGTWTEYRPIAKDYHDRRLAMRTQYANRLEDPETYPTPPPARPEFVKPAPVERPAVAKVQAAGWPFDAIEAKQRQSAALKQLSAAADKPEMAIPLGDGVQLDLVLVPAGEFVMGSAEGFADEQPMAKVKIEKPFWMARFETTNSQYALFDSRHDSAYISFYNKDHNTRGLPVNGPTQPVIRISWQQAMDYCRWLSQKTGRKFSLPTEAQWEYACRAGTASPLWYGDTTADFGKFANLADKRVVELCRRDSPKWIPSVQTVDDGSTVTASVGKYQANAWGLFDMAGNAAQWTRSAYRPYPYRADDGRDDPATDGEKVARGGSFYDRPQRGRSAMRVHYPPWQRVFNVGFRVVMEAE
jgi:formylglycine-generating enzyme required for sulfatase activity